MKIIFLVLSSSLVISSLKSMEHKLEQKSVEKTSLHKMLEKRGVPSNIWAINYSSDGHKIALSYDNGIKIWNCKKGKVAQKLEGISNYINCAKFCGDTNHLISSEGYMNETTLKLWDISTGKCLETKDTFFEESSAVSFSSDGLWCLHADLNKCVPSVWSVKDKVCLKEFNSVEQKLLIALAFSLNKQSIATGGDEEFIRFYDVESGNQTVEFKNSEGSIHSLAFSPDNLKLVSGPAEGGSIKVWDIRSGDMINKFTTSREVVALDWSPDGKTICYSKSNGESLYYLDIETGHTIMEPTMDLKDCSLW